MTEKTFNVPGMSCSHCKAAVEDELNELPGVEKANADVPRGTLTGRLPNPYSRLTLLNHPLSPIW